MSDRPELPAFLVDRPVAARGPSAGAGLAERPRADGRRTPGEPGLWIFVFGDMTVFLVFFGAFLVSRGQDPGGFAAAEQQLVPAIGAVNTLVLLTTSLLVASAVRAHRAGDVARTRRLIGTVLAGGTVFIALKSTEWIVLLAEGHDPASASFFMFYFAITGVHLLHVVAGIALLSVVHRRMRAGRTGPGPSRLLVESSASYWHMVDVLWLVIFPLAYFASGR